MINNTLMLVVLLLYYLLSDLSNMLLSVNLSMKSNQSKMFVQVAKVQLSVTFSPLTVTGHDASKRYNHVLPVKKKTYGCLNCLYINSFVA